MQEIRKPGGTGGTWTLVVVCETCERAEWARLVGYTLEEAQQLAALLDCMTTPRADRCGNCAGPLVARVLKGPNAEEV